jgi:hypothetical protein
MGVVLQFVGLPKQQELRKTNLVDLDCQLTSRLGERILVAPDQLSRPLKVMDAMILVLQGPEQRIVFQPMGLGGAELLVRRPQIATNPGSEVLPRLRDQTLLERSDAVKINYIRREVTVAVGLLQESVGNERGWTD